MYYVYAHVDPVTEEVLYIGKGTDGRAWMISRRGTGHSEYLYEFVSDHGRGSYVRIIADEMEHEDALILEKGLIALNQPGLNSRFDLLHDDDALDYKEVLDETEILWKPPVI